MLYRAQLGGRDYDIKEERERIEEEEGSRGKVAREDPSLIIRRKNGERALVRPCRARRELRDCPLIYSIVGGK